MTPLEADPLLTVNTVAKMFGVTTYTVRLWLREGKLQGVKLNNERWRVRQSEVERFANVKYGA